MISNLIGSGSLNRETDILVIGAGTVGLVMATQLAKAGFSVICIESGGMEQSEETHPLNSVEQVGTYYAGADHGRFRCLGGTSTRWGGALIPFQKIDMIGAKWPIPVSEIYKYISEVEDLFGLPDGNYDEEHILNNSDFSERLAKWPPFRNRNVFNLLNNKRDDFDLVDIWINATACDFSLKDGLLSLVTARAADGSSLYINAKNVIFAAGAIETTRLLLLMDVQNGGSIDGGGGQLGRHFHDHLSTVVADLVVNDRKLLNRTLGFRFGSNGAMRNLRFELSAASRLRSEIPPCFAHVAFKDADSGGFGALREVFRHLQRRKLPTIRALFGLLFGLPWLLRAVWWRYFEKRLLYPAESALELHMVIEQEPLNSNRLSLSSEKFDLFGNPKLVIDWKISEDDILSMHRASQNFTRVWNESPLARLALLQPRPLDEITLGMESGGGIYHPGGTTRMGVSREDGVVDADLCLFGVQNVRVVATSVLPTGGGGNPTMTLMMLGLRCVSQLTNLNAEAISR